MVSGQSDDDCNGLLLLLDSLYDDRDAVLDGLGLGCSTSSSATSHSSSAVDAVVVAANDNNNDDTELTPLVELVSSDDVTGTDTSALAPDHAFEIESILTSALDHVRPAHPQVQSNAISHSEERASPTTSTTLVVTSSSLQNKTPRAASASSTGRRTSANKARDERKSELIYLRNKVSELETQLSTIQAKRPRIASATAATPPRAATRTALSQSSVSAGARVWQDIAARQRDGRAVAERENVRLKLVLENQLRVAKSLETILNKKSTTKVPCGCLCCFVLGRFVPLS